MKADRKQWIVTGKGLNDVLPLAYSCGIFSKSANVQTATFDNPDYDNLTFQIRSFLRVVT